MDVKRLVDRMDEKKGSVKALHLEVKRTKKKKDQKRGGKKCWNVT